MNLAGGAFRPLRAGLLAADSWISNSFAGAKNGISSALDNFEQKQDEDDGEDERDATAAVIAKPGSHAVSAKAKHKNQDDQNDEHLSFSVRRRFA